MKSFYGGFLLLCFGFDFFKNKLALQPKSWQKSPFENNQDFRV